MGKALADLKAARERLGQGIFALATALGRFRPGAVRPTARSVRGRLGRGAEQIGQGVGVEETVEPGGELRDLGLGDTRGDPGRQVAEAVGQESTDFDGTTDGFGDSASGDGGDGDGGGCGGD